MDEQKYKGRGVLSDLTQHAPPKRPKIATPDLDPPSDEELAETAEFLGFLKKEEDEMEEIKRSYPLGTVRHNEPRSIHSKIPDPPWKRKLRP